MSKKETIYSYEQLPLMLSADHISAILGVSRANAYNIIHRPDFPSVQVGKRLIVPRDKFFEWVDTQCSHSHT